MHPLLGTGGPGMAAEFGSPEPRGATDLGPRTIIIDTEKEFRI